MWGPQFCLSAKVLMMAGGATSRIPSLRHAAGKCKADEKKVDSADASLPSSRRIFAADVRPAAGHGNRLLGLAGHFARTELRHRKGIRDPRHCVYRADRRDRLSAR